jgi:hypothetical protein
MMWGYKQTLITTGTDDFARDALIQFHVTV